MDTRVKPAYDEFLCARCSSTTARHTPPPGLAFGEPDDRLQQGIQYAAASRLIISASGILDRRSSRATTRSVKSQPPFCAYLGSLQKAPPSPGRIIRCYEQTSLDLAYHQAILRVRHTFDFGPFGIVHEGS